MKPAKMLGVSVLAFAQLVRERGMVWNKRADPCGHDKKVKKKGEQRKHDCGLCRGQLNAWAEEAQLSMPFPRDTGFGSGAHKVA